LFKLWCRINIGQLVFQECGLDLHETSLWPEKPWFYIWIKPRTTIRAIVDSEPGKYVLLLAALYGIYNALGEFSERAFGESVGMIVVILGALVIGPIGGLIGLYLSGAILRWSGSLLDGQASSTEARAAIAWSSIPTVIALLLWVPLVAFYGNEMFSRVAPTIIDNPYPLLLVGLIEIVLTLWTIVMVILTLIEVHRFSIWRSIGAVAIPFIVIIIPLFGCLYLAG